MHKGSLELTSIILHREFSGENFLRFELFCPIHGKVTCLNRLSTKKPNHYLPDLFDVANIHLTSPRQGTLFFLKTFHPILRHHNIPKNYSTFYYASYWIKIISMNLTYIDNLQYAFALTQKTLNAFDLSSQPHATYFKALYLLARHEGYPVKEDWLSQLPSAMFKNALSLLKNPLETQVLSIPIIESLIHHIHSWISQTTDILLPI